PTGPCVAEDRLHGGPPKTPPGPSRLDNAEDHPARHSFGRQQFKIAAPRLFRAPGLNLPARSAMRTTGANPSGASRSAPEHAFYRLQNGCSASFLVEGGSTPMHVRHARLIPKTARA